jgi:hypothetical protein
MPDTLTSGVWIALADDVAHGDFYRPLHGSLGTGGTRYMPLFFLLHGGMIKLGAAPLTAGVALTLGSVLALVATAGVLLRRLGLPREISWPAALLMLGAVSFEMMMLTVKGDYLAAAFNLGGIAAFLDWSQHRGRSRLCLTSGLFAAAFLTKITSVFGLGACVAWLLFRNEWRLAARLFAASCLMMLAGVILANLASDGRMWASFRAVASGDTDSAFALTSPVRFLSECSGDPLACILFVGACVCGTMLFLKNRNTPILWLAVFTALVTLVIFASPGTGANHLIDPIVVAALVVALALNQPASRSRIWAGITAAAFALGIIVSWLPGVPSIPRFFKQHHKPALTAVQEFIERAGPAAHPIFADNPLIPILAGERPFVADLFNLELALRNEAGKRAEMLGRLQAGEFGAVVLSNWPDVFTRDVNSPDDPLIAATLPRLRQISRVAEGFYSAMESRYHIVLVRRPYIYWLRTGLPFKSSP